MLEVIKEFKRLKQQVKILAYSRVHTAGCKSTYHRWQVPPGGEPVVSGGENAAGCNLPPTKLDLPPTIYL